MTAVGSWRKSVMISLAFLCACGDGDSISRLQSDQPEQRRDAIFALRREKSRAAVLPLIAVMKTDPVRSIRRDAARALGSLGDDRATLALVDTMAGFDDIPVRTAALLALEELRDPASVPAIIALWRRDDEDAETGLIQVGAADVLGRIADVSFEPLVASLADPHWSVRWYALSALGDMHGPQVREVVARHLTDPDERVRSMAQTALRRINRRRNESRPAPRPH